MHSLPPLLPSVGCLVCIAVICWNARRAEIIWNALRWPARRREENWESWTRMLGHDPLDPLDQEEAVDMAVGGFLLHIFLVLLGIIGEVIFTVWIYWSR